MLKTKAFLFAILIFSVTLIADQVTKVMVERMFELHESVEIFSWLNFTYVRNEGAAWGMFSGAQYGLVAVGGLAILLCTLFWKRFIGPQAVFLPLGGLLYAGIIGNIIDRLRVHYVIDFFDFHIGDWHYPCFNIADIAICVSVIGILGFQFYFERKAKKSKVS